MSDMADPLDGFPDRLRAALDADERNQEDIASDIRQKHEGFNKRTITRWLSGKHKPSIKKLAPVAEELGVDPVELLYGKEKPSSRVRKDSDPAVLKAIDEAVPMMRRAIDAHRIEALCDMWEAAAEHAPLKPSASFFIFANQAIEEAADQK